MSSRARLSLCFLAALSALAFLALLLRVTAIESSDLQAVGAGLVPAQTEPYDHDRSFDGLVRRVTHDGHTTPWAWTPDGQHLLVQRPGHIVDRQQLAQLWIVSVRTSAERRLSENALYPSVDQGRLVYLRYRNRDAWEAVVADLASGAPLETRPALWHAPPRWVKGAVLHLAPSRRWTDLQGVDLSLNPPQSDSRAGLSPDGTQVASTDGRTLSVTGRGGVQLIARADQVYGFAWSPGGTWLAYIIASGGPMPELWVWNRETGHARVLLRGEMEYMGEPAWSPDERTLALTRSPTGSSTTGDIWLVDVDAPVHVRPLALSEADERAPCWSPDGRWLAFSSDGDLYVADQGAPPQSPPHGSRGGGSADSLSRGLDGGGPGWGSLDAEARPPSIPPVQPTEGTALEPLGLTAPETIYVLHDARGNTCRSVPDGQIDAIPFEQYVKRVTPNEVPAGWPTETLKTQAVAARTYGWIKRLYQGDRPYTVKDSTADQYMCDTTYPSTDSAVDATLGQYVGYEGSVIWSFYCAEGSTPTNYRQWRPDIPYLRSVHDPGGLGKVRRGHSWGMSQWGAYRWASEHGWTYPQILAFYYTGATIEPSTARVWPLAAVVRPGSDSFITRDTVDLRALASSAKTTWPDSGVLTVTFMARLTDTWTPIYTDTNPADGWGTLWPVHALSDTITPSIALRATAYDLVAWRQESALSYVGINRSPPSGTLALAGDVSEVTTTTLSLVVTATDPSPTHLPVRVSLGAEHRVWEDHELAVDGGAHVGDVTAWDGSAWHVAEGQPGILTSADGHELPAGAYRVWIRLRVPAEALTNTRDLARLAVLDEAGELLGVRYPRGTEFKAGDIYQEFGVDLVTAEDRTVRWRVDVFGTSELWLDRISVASYPIELPGGGGPLDWSMPPREGASTVTARYVDGAENTAQPVSLTVTVVDLDPPAGWRNLVCVERTCSVEVRDVIAGLDTGSGAARLSFDAGLTWSAWTPVSCTGELGSREWETLTLPGVLPEAQGVGIARYCEAQVQFGVRDVAAAGNVGTSPVYAFDVCHHIYLPFIVDPAVIHFP